MSPQMHLGRREVVVGALAFGLMALPGMAWAQVAGTVAVPPVDMAGNDVLRRLLSQATQRAFARLGQPDGFYKSGVARFGLPVLFTKTGGNPPGALADPAFKQQLIQKLNNYAEPGARGASAPVTDFARKMTFPNPQAIIVGRPTSATSELRMQMGAELVNILIPPIEQALTALPDPVIAQAQAILPGVSTLNVAQSIAQSADNGIWYEIGAAEAEIRADPSLANDPVLTAALKR